MDVAVSACELFADYNVSVHQLNAVSLRSNYQENSAVGNDDNNDELRGKFGYEHIILECRGFISDQILLFINNFKLNLIHS